MRNEFIREADWKIARELKQRALDRHCERTLSEIDRVRADLSKTPHQRYLDIYQLMKRRDQEIADAFNGFRRSTAVMQIAWMRALGLFEDEEFSRFSEQTRDVVDLLLGCNPPSS